jgi:hypothetical protein
MTLKEVYTIIQDTCNSHLLIEQFESGNGYDRVINGNDIYPLAYLIQPFEITQTDVPSTTPFETYNLTIEILDKDDTTESNKIDLLSKTKTIGLQIVEKLKSYKNQFQLGDTVTIITVTDYSDDILTGCVFNISLSIPKEVNKACIDGIFGS